MMKILIVVTLLICSSSLLAVSGQLDPHGSSSVDHRSLKLSENQACAICHYEEKTVLKTHQDAASRCTNCHGKMPHSGMIEHKDLGCLSCHRPHRFSAIKSEQEADSSIASTSFIYAQRKVKNIPGVVESKSKSPMLARHCKECHTTID